MSPGGHDRITVSGEHGSTPTDIEEIAQYGYQIGSEQAVYGQVSGVVVLPEEEQPDVQLPDDWGMGPPPLSPEERADELAFEQARYEREQAAGVSNPEPPTARDTELDSISPLPQDWPSDTGGPVDEAPEEAEPVDESPEPAAPVDATPVESAPVDEAPADTAPVESEPAEQVTAQEPNQEPYGQQEAEPSDADGEWGNSEQGDQSGNQEGNQDQGQESSGQQWGDQGDGDGDQPDQGWNQEPGDEGDQGGQEWSGDSGQQDGGQWGGEGEED